MARKPNYDFEKRRKEQERAAKKEAKREDRLRRKQEGEVDDGIADAAEMEALTGIPAVRSEEPAPDDATEQ